MGKRFLERGFLAGVIGALVLAVAGCSTPPADPQLPACPARQEIVVEPATRAYPLPRAVSEDGEWVVTSLFLNGQLDLSVRHPAFGSAITPVGSVPIDFGSGDRPVVGVTPGASHVLFGVVGDGFGPYPATPLRRWDRATATVEDVPLPIAATAPPGMPNPPHVKVISDDGRRIVWRQAFTQAVPGSSLVAVQSVFSVTDAVTDELIAQWTEPLEQTTNFEFWYPGFISSHGHFSVKQRSFSSEEMEFDLIDLGSGAATDLGSELAAAEAAFPVPGGAVDDPVFRAVAVSDNARYLALERLSAFAPGYTVELFLWDRSASSGTLIARTENGAPGVAELTDSGALLWTPDVGRTDALELRLTEPDGSTPIATGLQPAAPFDLTSLSLVGTPDLRTVLFSRRALLDSQALVAWRCT